MMAIMTLVLALIHCNMINDRELERLENRRNAWLTLMFKALQGPVGIR